MLARLSQIQLRLAIHPLFQDLNVIIPPKQRIALVGRNGVGKSTLLKLLAGKIKPDSGQIEWVKGVAVSYLTQDIPDFPHTVNELLKTALLETHDEWQHAAIIDKVIADYQLPAQQLFNDLSGGLKRRVLLAKALMTQPDLLLLDEPTNHLDLTAIAQLEAILLKLNTTVLFVSHDRQFTRRLATTVYDLDRGQLSVWQCGYDDYLQRKQAALLAQEKENARFDKKLAAEEVWIRQGIKARRTRNEGRVRALKALRQQRTERQERVGQINLAATAAEQSGQVVIEAQHVSHAYADKTIINDFSTCIMRGDKIGIIGDNGCGKTTLLKILLNEMKSDAGLVKLGTQLQVLYFDQLRDQINDNMTVLDNIAGSQSHIEFAGKTMHIMGYLQQFLFSAERARSLAGTLSGGERNRLLLAKLLAKPANFLVMDEPSNDLDIETLELLENWLVDFNGTVLLVSHDRELINNVVSSTMVFHENGVIREYVGGYEDYLQQSQSYREKQILLTKQAAIPATAPAKKLSFEEQKELNRLPEKISKAEAAIEKMHQQLADPALYQTEHAQCLQQLNDELSLKQQQLQTLYDRWLELEEG